MTEPRLVPLAYIRHMAGYTRRWTFLAAYWRPGEPYPDALVADTDSPLGAICLLALNAKLLSRLEAVKWN